MLIAFLVTLLSCLSLEAQQQNFPGSSTVSPSSPALPALPCTDGATVSLTASPRGFYECNNGIWIMDAPGGGPSQSGNVYATSYGVKGNGNIYINGGFSFPSVSGASLTVTWISGAPSPIATDVGKFMQATSWDLNDNDYLLSTTLLNKCLITSVVVGTSWTCATGTSSASTGTGVLVVAPDDTAAWAAADAAAKTSNQCGTVTGPNSGISFITTQLFNTTPTCPGIMTGTASRGVTYNLGGSYVGGFYFVPTTDFVVANCTGLNTTYFFGFQASQVYNFNLVGFGLNPGGAQACKIMSDAVDTNRTNVTIAGWQNTSANVVGYSFGGGSILDTRMGVDGAGATTCEVVSGSFVTSVTYSFCQCPNTSNPAMVYRAGATLHSEGFGFGYCSHNTGNVIVQNSGATVRESHTGYASFGGANPSQLLFFQASGADHTILSANMNNTSTSSAGISAGNTVTGILRLVGGTVGGTVSGFSLNGATFTVLDVGGSVKYVNGGVAPTVSGTIWGTTPTITADAGNNTAERGSVTVTEGTGTPTTGTLILTFNQTFSLSGNPPQCQVSFKNGTGTWNARVSAILTTPTTTVMTWSVDNNAVTLTAASTYGVIWACTAR